MKEHSEQHSVLLAAVLSLLVFGWGTSTWADSVAFSWHFLRCYWSPEPLA